MADERGNAWRVPVDSYRGIMCLIGSRDGGKENEDPSEDGGGYEENFHTLTFMRADFSKEKPHDHPKKRSSCPAKEFDKGFVNNETANSAQGGLLGYQNKRRNVRLRNSGIRLF